MNRLLASLAALVVVASGCGSDGDSTSALEALGFSAAEAACYEDAYDAAGLDISKVLQADDLSAADAAARDDIAAGCDGASGSTDDSDDTADAGSGGSLSMEDLSPLERGMVEGMMSEGVSEAGALCVVGAIQEEGVDLGQLLRAGDDIDAIMSPEMMSVVFSCMDELFDGDSFSFGDFRDPDESAADAYGDDPELDALWDSCGSGDGAACDELYWVSPVDSEYEAYGNTCGDRIKEGAFSCEDAIGGSAGAPTGDAMFYGDDAYLDGLWDACAEGDGLACDDLYWESPVGSDYEEYGDTCGYMFTEGPASCADVSMVGPFDYGDDPELDALWEACSNWDYSACDELWLLSPIDSIYEEFGGTCGWYFADGVHDCLTELGQIGESSAYTYGDDPDLDIAWDDCDAGDLAACDDLYYISPIDSDYEFFGSTCGGRSDPVFGECVPSAQNYGDDEYLDGIYDDCEAGNLYACDELYQISPISSEYEYFGSICGGLATEEQWGSCAVNLGN